MRRSVVAAVVVSVLIAVVATGLTISEWNTIGRGDWQGWRILFPLAVAGSWLAVVGWATDRRLIAVPGHILSLGAPWGYLYLLPLVAVILALIAGATFRTGRNARDLRAEG
ncbi:MAG TPA: hypothetical protein VFK89_06180 [Actinomycetota bacterium]|nr:hypothetical protein [Actinomycetota bacterium]